SGSRFRFCHSVSVVIGTKNPEPRLWTRSALPPLPSTSAARTIGGGSSCTCASAHHRKSAATRRSGCHLFFLGFIVRIHDALGNLGELVIGFLLFLERFLEQVDDGVEFEQARVRNGRAVGGNLVVLHSLGCTDDRRVTQPIVIVAFAGVIVAL